MDQFVFVSHAVKDKPLLRPMVQALIESGIKVWLDAPAGLDYSANEIERHFYRIRAGGRWDDEINEAKREAACILVCWSKRAEGEDALKRHPVWFAEADYGRTEKKLVSCRIDDALPGAIPAGHGSQQMPDVRGDTERKLIVEDVKRMMAEHAAQSAGRRSTVNGRRSPRIPYLANRTKQEEAVEIALDTITRDGGVRPFFLVGPENECLDEFVQRLDEDTSRRCLGGQSRWETVPVPWQADETGAQFAQTFARRVAKGMGVNGQITIAELAGTLSARRRPVAVVSQLLSKDWKRDETARIKAWLDLWDGVAKIAGHRAVLPILRIKMPSAKPGWSGVPCNGGWFDGTRKRNKMIWEALGSLAAASSTLEVGRPPILCPLPATDIDEWRDKHFSLDDRDRASVLDALGRLVKVRENGKHGVPHADFAAVTLPFFRGSV